LLQETHKTQVSTSPGKLRLLETCQHEFREKLNIGHTCYIIIVELSYETQYKTWLRPPLREKVAVSAPIYYLLDLERSTRGPYRALSACWCFLLYVTIRVAMGSTVCRQSQSMRY